ncbi:MULTISPECIES: PhzF family phenazine biosynthesis protein [unclassified Streptomyces]|uniref:PhzF family phenazine biosynthesis protein n=1 Tax=unclassified Streptomyces TaxID=2593676 RepID=UPI001F04A756|nr:MULTISPECIES: PhzF family phenazine biosynthesis protein [unclassified Streptomyces]MCH0564866.1 PhzF family phenazine biosynthesis protein [Streptomyces sp. MUM 2J]MCH0569860.1 PhzF family phenazine biosynthesis protein [Streptomyces sp. MUM 136J]
MTRPLRRLRPFRQVDVFADTPYLGNPVAVVLDGEGLTDEDMARLAVWTNLSETTFVVPPSSDEADYALRIFTPGGEIPFAGHPTLGSAHAWLEAGGIPKSPGTLIQECGMGLVAVRRSGTDLSFRAPGLRRDGPLDSAHLDLVARGLGIARRRIVAHRWVDNGPGWAAVQLASAEEVLALEPDERGMRDLMLGVVGAYPDGAPLRFEVRAFAAPAGVREDPVTGSLNAGVAQWLIGNGTAPRAYRVGQGARVGRQGVLAVRAHDDEVWLGGRSVTCVRGEIQL